MKSVKVKLNQHFETILVVIVFSAILVIGWMSFDDYGVPIDDTFERETTFITLKNVVTRFVPEANLPDEIVRRTDLNDWEDRMYGVATQLPTAIVEWFFGFSLSQRNIYLLRHLWTFLQFYLGLIAFYFLLRIRFKSGWLAVLGAVSLWLSPRIFADSFYNIKDIVFLSWVIIAGLFLVRWLERRRLVDLILFSILASIATNIRIFGGILILYALLSIGLAVQRRAISFRYGFRIGALVVILYGAFWTLCLPYAWDHPIQAVAETLLMTSRREVSGVVLFFGEYVPVQEVPWHYLPVWIAITTPGIILLSFLAGFFQCAVLLFRRSGMEFFHVQVDGFAYSILLIPVGMTLILRPPLYNAYRHLFFIYPWMIYFAILFWDRVRLFRRLLLRQLTFILIGISLIWNGIWIARYHPFQMVYFSEWFPRDRRIDFDRDYWFISGHDALKWVLAHDSNLRIPIITERLMVENAMIMLPTSEADRLICYGMKPDMSDIRYVLINYSNLTQEKIDGYFFPSFEKTYELVVDGSPMYGISQRISRFMLTPERVQAEYLDGSTAEVPELSDDDRETAWNGNGVGRLELTIPSGTTIRGLTLFTVERMSRIPEEINIMVSSDGVTFESVAITDANYSEFFFKPVEARYLRIESLGTDTEWHISEIQAWRVEE